MHCTEDIEYKGFSLRISFDYSKAERQTLTDPGYPEMIEIEKVVLLHHETPSYEIWNGRDIEIDITELLHDKQFIEIEALLWEKKNE